MTYLEKRENGSTFHFRISMTIHGFEIVQGEFYKSISTSYQGEKSPDKELIAQNYINKKLAEGYVITEFVESSENTLQIYDKAKYHSGGNYPAKLDHFHSHIHTGMYVGWLIDNNLLNKEFAEESSEAIIAFKKRQLTGPRFYEAQMDGVFAIDEVNEIGNRFSFHYFDFSKGEYASDYEKTLAEGLPSIYHVDDTWENYDKIKAIIDRRFAEWSKSRL